MKVTRKLFVSVLAVVFAIVALGASTYAWFTLTNVNTVGDVELNVTSGTGLDISLDGVTYKSNLSSDDIMSAIEEANGASSLELRSVTSTNVKEFKNYNGSDNSYTDNTNKNIDYIYIPVWFKASYVDNTLSDAGVGVYLSNYSTTATYNAPVADTTWIVSKGVLWSSSVEFNDDASTLITSETPAATRYASDAVRVGFVTSDMEEEETLSNQKIFDFGKNADRGYAYAYGARAYFNAKNDDIITDDILTALPSQTVTMGSALTNEYTNNIAENNDSLITVLTELTGSTRTEYVGKVYLAVWLEGWDGDCFDAILSDKIIGQLNFRVAGKAA